MRALLISDIHSSYKVLSAISGLKRDSCFDLVIFAGDAVDMGEPVGFIEELIWTIDESNAPFFWVPGNNDFGRAYHKLVARYKSLEGGIVDFAGCHFTGVGGSPASWAGQYQGERSVDKKAIAGSIFISHVPPPGVTHYEKFDRNPVSPLEETVENTVNQKTNNISLKLSDAPLVHICGHVHHTWGIGYLGSTKVIKLAGAYLGHYAIIDLDTLEVKFERFWK